MKGGPRATHNRALLIGSALGVLAVGVLIASSRLARDGGLPFDVAATYRARAEELWNLGDSYSAAELWRRAVTLERHEDLDRDTNTAHPLFKGPVGEEKTKASWDTSGFTLVNRVKMRHDAEQLEHLIDLGLLSASSHGRLVSLYQAAVAELPGAPDEARFELQHLLPSTDYSDASRDTINNLGLLRRALNRAPHLWWPSAAAKNSTLSKAVNWVSVQGTFQRNGSIVVVDNALSQATLLALREWCETSTMWFTSRGSFVGALLRDAFNAPLLLQVADELRAALPEVLGQRRLFEAWAFKYSNIPEDWPRDTAGTGIHADQGTISINIWLTADDANEDPRTGGLTIFDAPAPLSYTYAQYNSPQYAAQNLALVSGASRFDVKYRCNRLILFASKLFHRAMPIRFRRGYRSRRINLTLLFE